MADDLTHSVLAIRAITGTNTSVAATVVNSTTILAANLPAAGNPGRLGGSIYNDQGTTGTATLYLSRGPTCTPTNFTVPVPPNTYYEIPFGYADIITGVWSAATGNARITEDK